MENNPELEKKLSYYMSLPYPIIITPSPEGSYSAKIPDLPGCITQGETQLEVLKMIEDAKRCWLTEALEDEDDIPEPDWSLYNGRLNLRIPKSLHRKLAAGAKREGVKLDQLVIYLIANGLGEQEKNF